LDALAKVHPELFHVWYTIDRSPGPHWPYSEGFVNEQMIAEHLPVNKIGTGVFMCGPPPMVSLLYIRIFFSILGHHPIFGIESRRMCICVLQYN
jgi:hypothetical protein